MKLLGSLSIGLLFAAAPALAQSQPARIDAVLAHAIFDEYYVCAEHHEGQLKHMGDALGADCTIQRLEPVNGHEFARAYQNGGERNEDWYGWGKNVLSPCDCTVERIHVNEVVNVPGVMGKGPASFVALHREDGIRFMLGHLGRIDVRPDEKVKAGQVIGTVGNNGYARAPHIHIGAFKDQTPYQIRFDLSRR